MLPWRDTSREQEQIRFILRWKGGEDTFTELCRQFSISRKTGYKRVERFKLWGLGDWEIEVEHRTLIPTPRLSQ